MPIKPRPNTQVEKFRQKLEHKINEEKKLLNIDAIKNMKGMIHQWLNTHASERIDLRLKSINLFDENQNSAAPKGKFISKLLSKIKADISSTHKFKANKIIR